MPALRTSLNTVLFPAKRGGGFAAKGVFIVTRNLSLLPGPLSNFTVLVSVSHPFLRSVAYGGKVTSSTGGIPNDVVFFADTYLTSVLNYEVVAWDPIAGTMRVWVFHASVVLGKTFYSGIGNPAITTFQGNIAGTWDSAYKLVDHFTGAGPVFADSSTNANDLTGTAITPVSGDGDGGASLDGATSYLSKSTTGSLNITGTVISIDVLFVPNSFGGGLRARIADHGNFIFYLDNSNHTNGLTFTADVGADFGAISDDSCISTGVLQHAAVTYDGTNVRFYAQGNAVGAPAYTTTIPSATNTLYVGDSAAHTRQFDGIIYEFRMAAATWSADEITAKSANLLTPGLFVGSAFLNQ